MEFKSGEGSVNTWALVVDVSLCINCRNCVLATKDEYTGNAFPGYSASHPPEGLETIRIERHVRGEGALVDVTYIPKTCNHCDNAPCIKAAPDGAIYKRPDGVVMIDPVKSHGRRDLVRTCPYGMIEWNEQEQVPQNWNFDAHLLDAGWKEPRCAQACPTKAIRGFNVPDAQLAEMVEKERLSVIHPEFGTRPRVFYKNLDDALSHLVTGNVCEEREDGQLRNLEDAEVILRDAADASERTTRTDPFGDFRFSGLTAPSSQVEIRVRKDGTEKVIATRDRTGNLSLGTLLF
ncbi:4Fe-4S dicluster domain-containing protein [Caballeronia ptereochthonis]|uniref:Iron-sulfur cluster protein n=1 Tax=Caballeronia ptereochthonis TaxID=1777144 RepID=A0A158AWC0_9BURK|nr:4Fe-4S dicluster domain-containing protein [Caballeronia ptereochthonis]SAK62043.1 iron-sulfur cluster protein [Caballeronia ptereochthonis]